LIRELHHVLGWRLNAGIGLESGISLAEHFSDPIC
jgi:hypothetical protein